MIYYNLLSTYPCDKIYVKKTYTLEDPIIKGSTDTYNPPKTVSTKYKNWIATLDIKTCMECRKMHGKIYEINDIPDEEPPLHIHCRCKMVNMDAVCVGLATKDGDKGADWWLKYFETLPNYYMSFDDAKVAGWRYGKSPGKYVPDKMLTRGIYENSNGLLPQSPMRIWYEADINYYNGRRNSNRILWSNDGLVFVTYDHYKTFCEII